MHTYIYYIYIIIVDSWSFVQVAGLSREGLAQRAFSFYRAAAGQGNVDAELRLGDYYYYGLVRLMHRCVYIVLCMCVYMYIHMCRHLYVCMNMHIDIYRCRCR